MRYKCMKKINGCKNYSYNRKFFARIFMVMKITLFFFFVAIGSVFADSTYSQNAFFSIKLNNATVQQVFDEIQKKSEFIIFYKDNQVDLNHRANIDAVDATVNQVLDQTLKGTNLGYKIIDRQIVILPSETKVSPEVVVSLTNSEQKKEISGTVKDSQGRTLPGVSVIVKGTTIGIVTDANGKFTLSVPKDAKTLVFSFIGMKTQEIAITAKTSVDLVMEEETVGLNEVVAIGYGTQKKRDVTGSISSISAQDILKTKIVSVDQALQGNASGVMVTQSSGQPGAAVSVLIRGAGRFGTSEPLYIIDGVIIEGNNSVQFVGQGGGRGSFNPLAGLNPDDILSMEVLKDAGSSAIYGARAGNGVIIITTKQGQKGKTKVSFDSYYGAQTVLKQVPILNTTEFFQYHKQLYGTAHPYDNASLVNFEGTPYKNVNTNWQDYVFKSAPIQNHTLNISGGNDFATYSISGGYFDQEGILLASYLKRYTLRSSTQFNVSKRIKAGLTLNLSRSSQRNNDDTGNWFSPLQGYMAMVPFLTPYTKDPQYYHGWNGAKLDMNARQASPFGSLAAEYKDQRNRLISNAYTEIEIFKGLKYKLNIGLDLNSNNNHSWNPSIWTGGYMFDPAGKAYLNEASSTTNGILIENTISYAKEIGKHSISAVAGISQQKNVGDNYNMGTTLLNNVQRSFDAGAGSPDKTVGGSLYEYLLRSQFGRLNYNYDGKYMLSATVRRDGSSRFGPDHRWGVFPAFSAGWRISKENFLSNVSFLSDMKLYGSWGQLGNDGIGNYKYAASLQGTNASWWNGYAFGDGSINQWQNGLSSVSLPNPTLKWEATQSTNIGITSSFLDNKLTLEVEYYVKKTKDLLVNSIPMPQSIGVGGPASNAASILNKGMDLSLGYNAKSGDFNFSIKGNLSLYLKNEVVSLGDVNPSPIFGGNTATDNGALFVTKSDIGHPVGSFWGYKMLGIWQEADYADVTGRGKVMRKLGVQPGDVRFDYSSKDTTITQQFIGNPNPKFSFGLTFSAEFKGIDLSVFVMGVQGNDIFSYWDKKLKNNDFSNYNAWVLGAWTPQNMSNTVPQPNGASVNIAPSSMYIQDGSYVRIKNIQLGYSLPKSVLSKLGIEKLRVYVTGQNLFTFTNYEGFDPELGGYTGYNTDRGIDTRNYPGNKTILFGIQLGF